jgi:calcineurin-like phosphoesterase family protein
MSTYLISDMHFGHENIIKYCNRPFKNAEEMDSVIIENINHTVKQEDDLYILGDFALAKDARKLNTLIKQINGKLHFIRGNHDRHLDEVAKVSDYEILERGKYRFLLAHRPYAINNPDLREIRDPLSFPRKWDGWIIHGHEHNHDLSAYPFINGYAKTINVSVELTDYKPVSLDWIMSLDLDGIKRLETAAGIIEKNKYKGRED